MTLQSIKSEVKNLSIAEQAELMHFMIELLTTEHFTLSEEWKTELEQREKSLEKGDSKGKLLKDVLAKYKAQ